MRLLKIFLSFIFPLMEVSVTAQSNQKLLSAQSRFLTGSVYDSVFFLRETGDPIRATKITFLPTGRLKIESQKTKADSQWHYGFHKRIIYFSLLRNDSVYNRPYEIIKSDHGTSFRFNRLYNYAAPVARPGDTIFVGPSLTNNLVLQKNNQKKRIYEGDDISVFYSKKGLAHDSIEYMARGQFSAFASDTICLRAEQLQTHNFYKKYTDSLHHTFYFPDSVILVKIPAKDLMGIYYHRSAWTSMMTLLTIAGLTGELIFLPAALLSKSDKANTIFGNLAIVSIFTWPTAATLGIIFSKKKFRLKETGKKKGIWQIVPSD
jgi:hypothetical protein